MLKHFFLAFLLIPLFISAQKTGKDTLLRYFNSSLEPVKKKEAVFIGVAVKDPSGWNTVVYNDSIKIIMRGRYLDDDCKIREGYFMYNDNQGINYMGGHYSRNKKTGWWHTWFPTGGIKDSVLFSNDLPEGRATRYFESGKVESTGNYKAGVIEGDWTWYHENGNMATRENYADGKLTSLDCFDTTGAPKGSNCAINRPPAIKGLYGGIEKFVKDSLRYPPQAFEKEVQGYVVVKFLVTKSGEIADPVILSAPDPSLSQEALRVIKSIPACYPAISHNRSVEYTYTLKIPFYIFDPMLPVTELEVPRLN